VSPVSTRREVESSGAPPEPLGQFLERAAARACSGMEGCPADQYRSPAMVFARCLKARPEFTNLSAEQATALVDQHLDAMFPESPQAWVALGLPDQDSRGALIDPRTDFLSCWEKVTTPLRLGGAVDDAAKLAAEYPLHLGERFAHPADARFRHLVSICYHLSRASPTGEFFLGCRDAGRALGVSYTEASKLLARAEAQGMIRSKPYTAGNRKARQAREWRYTGPR
jgi:hypothetical protein